MSGDKEEAQDEFLDDPEMLDTEEAEEEQQLYDDPKVQVGILIEERDDYKDRWMRAVAETDNVRKRAMKDAQNAASSAVSKIAEDVVNVYNNLNRALAAITDEQREANASLVEGIELTQKEIFAIFEKNRIELIEPKVGDVFDPNLHQAMFEAPVPGTQAGDIIQVTAVGYQVGGRLKAAQVGVSSMADGGDAKRENEESAE